MRTYLPLLRATCALVLILAGCGSDDSGTTKASVDAGQDSSHADGATLDAADDGGAGADSGADTAPSDDGSADDAQDDGGDAAQDVATEDSVASDADVEDAGESDAVGTDASGGDTADGDATDGDGTDGATPNSDAADGDAAGGAWSLPTCTTPTGAPGVAFGANGGATLQISPTPLKPGKTYTAGLAATGAANVLFSEHAGTVSRSQDGGCSWTAIGEAKMSPSYMVPGLDDRAYGFYDNGQELYRVQGNKVTSLQAPTTQILGVAVHPSDVHTVRLGDMNGQIWENHQDGDGKWTPIGKAPGAALGYRVAFSPLNLDRVLYGTMNKGLLQTTDGGQTWISSTFVGAYTPVSINGMNAAFSPVEEERAWAMAIDLSEGMQAPSPTNGKYLWRSDDGGKSFHKVVAHLQPIDVTLTNGVHLNPDAHDAAKLRWAFGTCFSGYGTNLYLYDENAVGTKLSWVNHPIPGIVEIVQHPANPSLLVLGLRGDDNPQCP